jgi:hypothetical protein
VLGQALSFSILDSTGKSSFCDAKDVLQHLKVATDSLVGNLSLRDQFLNRTTVS